MESSYQWNAKTKVEFLKKLPSESRLADVLGFRPEKYLIIYDKRVGRVEPVRRWLKEFQFVYGVPGGESLKDLSDFTGHLRKIFRLLGPFSAKSICLVGLGGGSVGDFVGFVSSVLKRGVPLIHIPTTLLAAMDSAHGGKTALNVGEMKNQVGTFYPADGVMIVRSLFEGLPGLQLQSAGGELAKMALLAGGPLFSQFRDQFDVELDSLWEMLPAVIEAKYKIVDQDPLEQNGARQVLNLGHTLGHVLESYYGLAHGVAVGQGLAFAIRWSEHQGYLRDSTPDDLMDLLNKKVGVLNGRDFARQNRAMSRSKLARFLEHDKKLTDTRHVNFIFLEDVGAPFRKAVTLESFLTETQRQGWTAV